MDLHFNSHGHKLTLMLPALEFGQDIIQRNQHVKIRFMDQGVRQQINRQANENANPFTISTVIPNPEHL